MTRFDRYLLSRLLVLFGFFALVLVAVYWVNRAVSLVDTLVADGQSVRVFLEFTALTLPNVTRLVLPVAAFVATVYAVNRMVTESEFVVMQAIGLSALRLARPVLAFGLIVAVMLGLLLNWLVPASRAQMVERRAEIAENITARLLTEGSFIHPTAGVTLFVGRITPEGALEEVFLSDARAGGPRTLYTARQAFLVRTEAGPQLVMVDGMAQSLRAARGRGSAGAAAGGVSEAAPGRAPGRATGPVSGAVPAMAGAAAEQRLSVTTFDTLTYDLAALVGPRGPLRIGLREMATPRIVMLGGAGLEAIGASPAAALLEVNSRVAQPLMAMAAALIGFAALTLGAFSRLGIWRQVLGAAVAVIVMQGLHTVVTGVVLGDAALWPLVYLPPALGLGGAVAALWWGGRVRRPAPMDGPLEGRAGTAEARA